MPIRFDNKVAVITGAGNGLGRSHALFLASRGAKVVVNDLGATTDGIGGSQTPAQKVVDEIKAAGGQAVANYDDVGTAESAKRIIQTALDSFGTVDILICNAGILRDKTFLKMPLEDFELVMRVHFWGTIYPAKAAFPIMKDKGYGRIVFTTSTSGLFGNFGQTNYGAAKAAIVGFMNALKLEGEKYNIRVNTIAPLAASRLAVGTFPESLMPFLKPDYVTAAVAYLCSEQCTATGDIIAAGGGYYAKAQMFESQGVRFERGTDVTPEMIAERYGEITNMSGAAGFYRSSEETRKVFAPLMESS